jgi:hypothetical protein
MNKWAQYPPSHWRQIMVHGWKLQRRQRQAELIRQWTPWSKSTGPKSPEGKVKLVATHEKRATCSNCMN